MARGARRRAAGAGASAFASAPGPAGPGEEEDESWRRLREEAAAARLSGSVPLGEVFLVGAGPGDPGLLTVRAAEVLARADVVLRDRLISEDILGYINKDARVEYVGKSSGFHTRTQDQIHELLYIFAETGKTVVRLKVRTVRVPLARRARPAPPARRLTPGRPARRAGTPSCSAAAARSSRTCRRAA